MFPVREHLCEVMQTTEQGDGRLQGDGRFFHEGASSVQQYTDTEPACLVWEPPLLTARHRKQIFFSGAEGCC